MFARFVTIQLKPKMAAEFKQAMETAVLPLLHRQTGFQEELVLLAPDGREAVGISLWESQQHAEAYSQKSYPEVQQLLSKTIDAPPVVKAYEVTVATFQKKTAGGGRQILGTVVVSATSVTRLG